LGPGKTTLGAISAGDLRITALAALTWRAMTEIVRRRHITHDFNLLQVHPGISIAGLIQLHLRARDDGRSLPITFNLGGPYPGSWEAADGTRGSLLDLLGRAPVAAIDAIERAAGLPAWPGRRLPASSPAVRGMRRIAAELESRVFQPRPWRTTAALVGWSPDMICDWHRHFTRPVTQLESSDVTIEDRERLSRLILVHEAPDEACVTAQAALRGEGLVVDLATGDVWRMNAKAAAIELPAG
jgi:hypothetical protein